MELKFDPDNPKYEYLTTPAKAEKALRKLEKEPIIAIDIEGTGLEPYTTTLLLVQIGTPEIAYIFDARKLKLQDIPLYKKIMENPKTLKIFHNGKFDYGFLKTQTGVSVNNMYDTMLAESILDAGINPKPSKLSALSHRYLEIVQAKDVRETFVNYTGKITEDQLKYSALDVLVLHPIMERQYPRIQEEGLTNVAKLEFAVTVVVAEMELKGMKINVPQWRGILKNLAVKRHEHAQKFQELVRPYYNVKQMDMFGGVADAINMNSQVQLMDLFNNRIGLNIPSTGVGILLTLDHPVAKALRDYRGYEKLISAFGENLLAKISKVTGRIHPDFMQLGTATGRFACRNPNLQQIPKVSEEAPFRKCMNPEPGYKLVTTDYSSMEMRILADLSGDKMLCQAIEKGYDLHSHTASLMFDLEYTPDFRKKYPEQRQAAKAINFGLVYGMGAQGLAKQIDKSVEEAEDLMNKYFKNYPSIKGWLDRVAKEALRKGYSTTPLGRKRQYVIPERSDPDYRRRIGAIQREAKNHPIQGTNADATKIALVFLWNRIKKDGVDAAPVSTVHDEVVFEVRDDQAEDWAKVQRSEMIRAAKVVVKNVPIESEPFVGDVWEH